MTIAHVAASGFSSQYSSTGSQTTSVAGGTCRAAVVLITQEGNSGDQISGVTYAGAAMTRIAYVGGGGTGSPRAVYIYWLDGVTTGTQNVIMTTTGSNAKRLIGATMSVASGKIVAVAGTGSNATYYNATDPMWSISGLTSGSALSAYQILSIQNINTTVVSGWTENNAGSGYIFGRKSIASSTTSLACGWSNSSSTAYAGASVAFIEATASTPVTYTATAATSTSLMVDPVVDFSTSGGYTAEAGTETHLFADPSVTTQRSPVYTATTATASAEAVQPTLSLPRTVTVTVATATGEAGIHRVIQIANFAAIADISQNAADGSAVKMAYASDSHKIYIKTNTPSVPGGRALHSAYLKFKTTTDNGTVGPNMTCSASRVTGNWSEAASPNTTDNADNTGSAHYTGLDIEYTMDITSIVAAWIAGSANYGIVLKGTGGTGAAGWIYSRESAYAPSIDVRYLVDSDVTVTATPITGSALAVNPVVSTSITYASTSATESHLMVNPVIDTTSDVTYGVTAFASTGVMVGSTITAIHGVDVAVDPFTATAVMPEGIFAVPVTVNALPSTESHEFVAPVVTSDMNAITHAPVATGTVFMIPPLEAQQDNADPYYNRVHATTDADDYWYRLDEVAGTTLVDARANAANIADLGGAYNFGVFGPESRKSVHFTDGWFKPRSATVVALPGAPATGDFSRNTTDFTFEITLRTTDQNGLLAFGMDNVYQNAMYYNAISIKDGLVNVEYTTIAGWGTNQTGLFDFSGFKNVADGEWHHIVVAFRGGNPSGSDNLNINTGIRIFIDGQLDRRRRLTVVPGATALPDYWMGVPTNVSTPLALVKNFTGDVMEVVFRRYANLVADDAQALYYDVFGICPVYALAATATGLMPNALGKGNKKKVLVLWRNIITAGLNQDELGGFEVQSDSPYPENFDHNIALGFYGAKSFNDMTIIPMKYMRDERGDAEPYRDDVTDLPRLINLQRDVDMTDVDLIVFRNWPDESNELRDFAARGYNSLAIDAFLASVKQAVVDGCGLEVTSPYLAARLGLINGAMPVPTLYEHGPLGEVDARSATINPWDNDHLANVYLDTHGNNFHRVMASVDGLTTIPSEIMTEAVSTWNFGTDGKANNKWYYKLSDRPTGLSIGETFMDAQQFLNKIRAYNARLDSTGTLPWNNYVWAITPTGLNAGTPLYKFATTTWAGNTQVANPYADYIGGAVVQPGDSWGGVRIAGKVFINFAEFPFYSVDDNVRIRQLVPPNEEVPNPQNWETTEMREWDYSYARIISTSIVSGSGQEVAGTGHLVAVMQPDGSTWYKYESGKDSAATGKVIGLYEFEKYPTEPVIILTWTLRGLAWLSFRDEVPAGSKVIRPLVAEANGVLVDPVTIAQRSVTIVATPAQAIGQMIDPDEVVSPDVTVYAFAAEATGIMTGYGKTISIDPFLCTGMMAENFNFISAGGEQVVLYLYNDNEIDLYLKEDK